MNWRVEYHNFMALLCARVAMKIIHFGDRLTRRGWDHNRKAKEALK